MVRRTSGGGTIFTDKGQLIYGLVTGKNLGKDIEGSFKEMCTVIIDALSSFGIESGYKPPNDIILNGKKISGNALIMRDKAVLMHGTLIRELDSQLMSQVLKDRKPGHVSSIKAECGFAPAMDDLKDAIRMSFEKRVGVELVSGQLTDFEHTEIERLIKERYGCDEWNYKR